jgi:hypothetical protein
MPGGMWNSDKFEVKGLVSFNGAPTGEINMTYSGKPSQFSGTVKADKKGVYQVTVYTYDSANGNTGLDCVSFIIN